MCTAATYKTKNFYFGRTLDYEFLYGDEITVTPRNYPFEFRYMGRTAQNVPDIRCCRGRTSTGRTKYLLPLGPGKYQEITWRFYLHFCILRKICAVLCNGGAGNCMVPVAIAEPVALQQSRQSG